VSALSYWERSIYFHDVDVAIIGAGIVGLCTGISLLERDPALRVIILERNYLPLGASTKNAGFACFGSPSELLDDLQYHDESKVFSLFKRRYDGIQKLLRYTGSHAIDLKRDGGFELIHPKHSNLLIDENKINYLNSKIYEYTGIENYFYFDDHKLKEFGLKGFDHLIANNHEAGLHPVKMIEVLSKLFTDKGGKILYGASLDSWQELEQHVLLKLHDQTSFEVKKIIFCVNGFANKLLPELAVEAARNMVLLIQPYNPIRFKGCFHMDRGYVYMRDLDGKLLIGGGRNKDLQYEFTDEFGINETIKSFLLELAKETILMKGEFKIIDQWSGILGLGPEKKPIIKMISNHTAVAVRMGGMGIAIGSLVGDEAAEMVYNSIHELR
jgi:gamma-glutamylputrescine oxidase